MNWPRIFFNLCISLLLLTLLLFAAESVYSNRSPEILFSAHKESSAWVLKAVLPVEIEVLVREGKLEDGEIVKCNPQSKQMDNAAAYLLELNCDNAKLAVGRLRFNR